MLAIILAELYLCGGYEKAVDYTKKILERKLYEHMQLGDGDPNSFSQKPFSVSIYVHPAYLYCKLNNNKEATRYISAYSKSPNSAKSPLVKQAAFTILDLLGDENNTDLSADKSILCE